MCVGVRFHGMFLDYVLEEASAARSANPNNAQRNSLQENVKKSIVHGKLGRNLRPARHREVI